MSSSVGTYLPVMTSWEEGLGFCSVIQNHKAVLKATMESFATTRGFASPSNPKALPATDTNLTQMDKQRFLSLKKNQVARCFALHVIMNHDQLRMPFACRYGSEGDASCIEFD
ncbi:hypothetical protein GBA52_009135 [Prunus armeniaca]|nr:hypothetical protein GBA52_009135 [Prunus armeniaca]